jgi:hypothetical protein
MHSPKDFEKILAYDNVKINYFKLIFHQLGKINVWEPFCIGFGIYYSILITWTIKNRKRPIILIPLFITHRNLH